MTAHQQVARTVLQREECGIACPTHSVGWRSGSAVSDTSQATSKRQTQTKVERRAERPLQTRSTNHQRLMVRGNSGAAGLVQRSTGQRGYLEVITCCGKVVPELRLTSCATNQGGGKEVPSGTVFGGREHNSFFSTSPVMTAVWH